MSDLSDFGYSPANAAKYNARAADSVGWRGSIPDQTVGLFPSLIADPDTERFAEGVHDVQQILFKYQADWDGKLGKGTWRKILKK